MQYTMDLTKLHLVYFANVHTPDLCDLYLKVFNKKVKPNYFTSKYGLNDDHHRQCSTVAMMGDDVVGFFGCIGQEYLDHRRRTVVSLGYVCDFILLEPYRGKGVFELLYKHTLDRAVDEQYEIMFGLQSDQTYKFCQRMGWEDGRSFDRFQVVFRKERAAKIRAKLAGPEKMLERVTKALQPYKLEVEMDQFNLFQDAFSRKYDPSFFFEKGASDQRFFVLIEQAVMWLKYDGRLVAGMIRFLDDFDAEKFQASLQKILRPTGIHDLTFHVQRSTNEHLSLSAFLEAKNSFKVSFTRTYEDGCHVNELALNYMDVDIF